MKKTKMTNFPSGRIVLASRGGERWATPHYCLFLISSVFFDSTLDFEVRRRGSTSRFEARGRGSRQPSRRALPPSSYPPGGLPRPENHPPRPSNLSPYLTSRPLHRRAAADRGKMMGSGSKKAASLKSRPRPANALGQIVHLCVAFSFFFFEK